MISSMSRLARRLYASDDVAIEKLEYIRARYEGGASAEKFGVDPEYLEAVFPAMLFAYRYWFRTRVHGIENIPEDGAALIISNHSGQVPVDGMLLATVGVMEMERPRLVRSLVDYWVPGLPFVNILFTRIGQCVGVWENAELLLQNKELLLIFPEGTRGLGKTWDKRYQLQHFTPGFLELSIQNDAKIIPTAVIGGEEQMPSIINAKPIADMLKAPYFPITPTFPLLGLRGAIPYPVKYDIYFGPPMNFSDYAADLENPDAIAGHVETVRGTIQQMLDDNRRDLDFSITDYI